MMFKGTSPRTTIICQMLLTVLALIFAAPLLVMIKVSLQGRGFGNYLLVLQQPYLPRFFLNSTFVTVSVIGLVYAITVLAAFAFSKLRFRGNSLFFSATIVGLMIPGVALVVPIFLLIHALNLFNNYLALILPITAGLLPFGVLLMRTGLDGVPNEILDAALIDGCDSFQVLIMIIIPLIRPITVVLVVFSFLASWNDYFTALAYVRNDQMLPLTHLPNYFIQHEMNTIPDYGPIFASLVLISLPIMITYVALQKYFEDGFVSGALK